MSGKIEVVVLDDSELLSELRAQVPSWEISKGTILDIINLPTYEIVNFITRFTYKYMLNFNPYADIFILPRPTSPTREPSQGFATIVFLLAKHTKGRVVVCGTPHYFNQTIEEANRNVKEISTTGGVYEKLEPNEIELLDTTNEETFHSTLNDIIYENLNKNTLMISEDLTETLEAVAKTPTFMT